MITAEMILKSRNPHNGAVLRTFRLVYPAIIHTHVLTHRAFSRNTSSSRAIPAVRFAELVQNNPAMPIFWGKNCKGMKAQEEVEDVEAAKAWWLNACDTALTFHQMGVKLGLHKEVVNRILQPFQHVVVLLSTTSLGNWEDQRLHGEGVQGETYALAKAMHDIDRDTEAVDREHHLPLLLPEEIQGNWKREALASAARCARVSFLLPDCPFEEEVQKGIDMTNKKHRSPFEHQAVWYDERMHAASDQRNFRGWAQHRAMLGL